MAQARELRVQEARHQAYELCAEVSAGAIVWYQDNPRVSVVPSDCSPGFDVFVHPGKKPVCSIFPGYEKTTLYPAVSFDDGRSRPLYAPDSYNGLRMLTEVIDVALGVVDDRQPS